jgi:hypothetical protein
MPLGYSSSGYSYKAKRDSNAIQTSHAPTRLTVNNFWTEAVLGKDVSVFSVVAYQASF